MAARPRTIFLPVIALTLMVCQGAMAPARATNLLQVPFVLLRLEPQTLDLLGAYQYEQPYRKSLLPECNPGQRCSRFQVDDQYVLFEEPSDFGRTTLVSRLTGQRTFDATSIWGGTGILLWPTPAEAVTDFSRGSGPPEPALFTVWSVYGGLTRDEGRRAWDAMKDLNIISGVAAAPYGVFVTDHHYDVFAPEEIILIVHGKPRAPIDAGLVKLLWPEAVLAEGVPAVPEVRLHNFSDEDIDAEVELEVTQGQSVVRRLRQSVADLPADTDATVTFDAFTPVGIGPLSFRARLAGPAGSAWSDAFFDNDAVQRGVESLRLPVYRAFPRTSIPVPAYSIDFDGDGDLDAVTWAFNPRFLRNDQSGYVDITSRVSGTLPYWPFQVLARDMTGDGLVDVLFDMRLLRGDGRGNFMDVTATSGFPGAGTPFDIDEDGDLDVLTQLNGIVRVYHNDGAGHFTDETAGSGIEPIAIRSVQAIGQVIGDGRPDLVLAGWTLHSSVYENLGGGTFLGVAYLPDSKLTRSAAILDYDGDGLSDLFLTGYLENRLYRQQSPADFVDVSSTAGPLGGFGMALPFDVDADGWTDLALDFPPRLLRNAGGVFQDESRLLITREDTRLEAGRLVEPKLLDLDDDGDDDLHFLAAAFENLGLPRPTHQPLVERVAPRSGGMISLIAYGSSTFDVRLIDRASVSIGPAGAAPAHPRCGHLRDADNDGSLDILFHARRDATGLKRGESACLDGALADDTRFRGCEPPAPAMRSRRNAEDREGAGEQ